MFNKKTILKKTIQIGWCTQLSRFLGIIREILITKFLGASALSDAFFTAYKIPNSLRRAFAEGALSAAFIPPTVKKLHQDGTHSIAGLMSLAFIVFEGLCLLIVGITIWNASWVIHTIAPGFSAHQTTVAVHALTILMPFIFFISSSALLAGPLQAIGHFLIPALSPVLLNVFFIVALFSCITCSLSLDFLCWFIVLGGLAQFIAHLITFFYYNFSFGLIKKTDIKYFGTIFFKFLLCLPSVSIEEVNLFIDTSFASLLAKGSVSLIYLANRFMGIPLGVFAVSFSTVLLPHFSKLQIRAPKRLSFYLLESVKFVFWITIPIALTMSFFSYNIFYTLFLSDKFTVLQVQQAASILSAFLTGLFFFSINKILLNIYYALHITWVPALISVCAVLINWQLNTLFVEPCGAVGLALASVLAEVARTVLFIFILHRWYNFKFYTARLCTFFIRYIVQIIIIGIPFLLLFYGLEYSITHYLPEHIRQFLLYMIGYWMWVGPLCGFYFLSLWYLRTLFKVHIFFLD